jgi:hypothetical protein
VENELELAPKKPADPGLRWIAPGNRSVFDTTVWHMLDEQGEYLGSMHMGPGCVWHYRTPNTRHFARAAGSADVEQIICKVAGRPDPYAKA